MTREKELAMRLGEISLLQATWWATLAAVPHLHAFFSWAQDRLETAQNRVEREGAEMAYRRFRHLSHRHPEIAALEQERRRLEEEIGRLQDGIFLGTTGG